MYRSSKKTIRGWNRLLRYHRHLRHLEVRTRADPDEEEEQMINDDDEAAGIDVDESLLSNVNRNHPAYQECAKFADKLAYVYRQEMLEILNLYGLSHESDLWCRNSVNGLTGELEDTAYTELEQLVVRTRSRFFYKQIESCATTQCDEDSSVDELCVPCRKSQQSIAVACYRTCYAAENVLEQAPVLSLPWLFAGPMLQDRIDQSQPPVLTGLLGVAMRKALDILINKNRRLILKGTELIFQVLNDSRTVRATVDLTVCVFIEVLQQYMKQKKRSQWPLILNRFIQTTESFSPFPRQPDPSDRWKLILQSYHVNTEDAYVVQLSSLDWTETEDRLMHDYFEEYSRTFVLKKGVKQPTSNFSILAKISYYYYKKWLLMKQYFNENI